MLIKSAFLLALLTVSTTSSLSQFTPEIADSIMRINYPDNEPGATIIICKDNKEVFSKSYGLANISDSTKLDVNDVFRIGSITKQFTAISILMLVEKGRLELTDPLTDYYPKLFADKPTIKISHLLTHTSGIPDLPRIPKMRERMFNHSEPDTLISIIAMENLEFEPGERYSYSNSGYVILGGIIEKISEMTYEEFLTENIFTPLDMKDTYISDQFMDSTRRVVGYFRRPNSFVEAPFIHHSLLYSAGGISSNVKDMAKWGVALNSGNLIPKNLLLLAETPSKLSNGSDTDYGFAFRNCEVNQVKSIEHGGGAFGYKSYSIRIPEQGIYVLILSNYERDNPYDELTPIITAQVLNNPYKLTDGIEIEPVLKKQMEGLYLSEFPDTIRISFEDELMLINRFDRISQLKRTDNRSFYGLNYSAEFDPLNPNQLTIKFRRAMKEKLVRLK